MLTFLWSLAQCKHSSSLRNARLVYLLLVLLNASTSSSLQPSKLSPVSCVVLFSTPRTCRAFQHATPVPCTLDSPVLVGVLEPRVLVDGLGAVAAVGCRYCAAHLDLLDVAIGSRACVRAGSLGPP
jgi:hypothetical protein